MILNFRNMSRGVGTLTTGVSVCGYATSVSDKETIKINTQHYDTNLAERRRHIIAPAKHTLLVLRRKDKGKKWDEQRGEEDLTRKKGK